MHEKVKGCNKYTRVRGRSLFAQARETPYTPTKSSPEAQICLGCNIPKEKCKGDCKRYRTLHNKLKGQKNGK